MFEDEKLLLVKQERLSRRVSLPCSADSDDDLTVDVPLGASVSRKSSIHVIVTADYAPNNLSNNDYDKLKQVNEPTCNNELNLI